MDKLDITISDLNDISEILDNNGYGGWCKTLDKAVELLKEQQERIKVLEEEAKTKSTPQKVLNRKELADLIVGECPLCGALFNKEICPTSCGWCGCLLDWKDGEQE